MGNKKQEKTCSGHTGHIKEQKQSTLWCSGSFQAMQLLYYGLETFLYPHLFYYLEVFLTYNPNLHTTIFALNTEHLCSETALTAKTFSFFSLLLKGPSSFAKLLCVIHECTVFMRPEEDAECCIATAKIRSFGSGEVVRRWWQPPGGWGGGAALLRLFHWLHNFVNLRFWIQSPCICLESVVRCGVIA